MGMSIDITKREFEIRLLEDSVVGLSSRLPYIQEAKEKINSLRRVVTILKIPFIGPIFENFLYLKKAFSRLLCPSNVTENVHHIKNDLGKAYQYGGALKPVEKPQYEFIFENTKNIPCPAPTPPNQILQLKNSEKVQQEKKTQHYETYVVLIDPPHKQLSVVVKRVNDLLQNKIDEKSTSAKIQLMSLQKVLKQKDPIKGSLGFSFYLSSPIDDLSKLNNDLSKQRQKLNGNCVLVALNTLNQNLEDSYSILSETGYIKKDGTMKKSVAYISCSSQFDLEEPIQDTDLSLIVNKIYEITLQYHQG